MKITRSINGMPSNLPKELQDAWKLGWRGEGYYGNKDTGEVVQIDRPASMKKGFKIIARVYPAMSGINDGDYREKVDEWKKKHAKNSRFDSRQVNARTSNSLSAYITKLRKEAKLTKLPRNYGDEIFGYLMKLIANGDINSIDVTPQFFKVKSIKVVEAFKGLKSVMNRFTTKGIHPRDFDDIQIIVDLLTAYVTDTLVPAVADLVGLSLTYYGEFAGYAKDFSNEELSEGNEEGLVKFGKLVAEGKEDTYSDKIISAKEVKRGTIYLDTYNGGENELRIPFDGVLLAVKSPHEVRLELIESSSVSDLISGEFVISNYLDDFSYYASVVKLANK